MKKEAASLFLILFNYKKDKYKQSELETIITTSFSKLKVMIEEINMFLEKHNIKYLEYNEDEIIIHEDFYLKETLDHFYNMDFYEYQLDAVERGKIILAVLLMDYNTKTMEYFAELFNVSRMTIVRDIKILESTLDKVKEVSFESLRGKGLKITADEVTRRRLLINLILEDLVDLELLSYLTYQIVSMIEVDIAFEDVVRVVTSEVDVSYNFSIPVVIFVIISRRDYEQLIEYNDAYTYEYISIQQSNMNIEFATIIDKLSDEMNLSYTLEEMNRVFSFYSAYRDHERNKTDLYNIILSFLQDIDKDLEMQLSSDFLLIQDLYNHLKTIKSSQFVMLDFENAKEFQKKYYNIIQAVNSHIDIIEKYTGYKQKEPLILSVSIHVVSAYIRKFTNVTKCKTIIVVDQPMSIARVWELELNQINGIQIESILSKFDYEKLKLQDDIDLIISNEKLNVKNKKVKYCVIKKLGNLEKAKIKNTATDIIFNKDEILTNQTISFPILNKYLEKSSIKIVNQEVSWQEAISQAGYILFEKGYIDKSFIDRAIHNVDIYGPYIVFKNGVALAHANSTGNVYKNSVSLVKFSKAVKFSEDPNFHVQLLFFVAFSSSNNYPELLKEILSISEDYEKIESIKQCEVKQDIYKIMIQER